MAALKLIRTNSENTDFRNLVTLLDNDLAHRDGDEHFFYAQFNKIDSIKQVVVAYFDEIPVACGAIKPFTETAAEIKRMFVHPDFRNKGFAFAVLSELENWAAETGLRECVLETGKKQPEAISLYHKAGFTDTPNFGQYIGVDNSVCMKKVLQKL